ncbi:MAG: UvrD-helicase domain-containing protein, partial [Sulfurovaceae bacterium]|nr:UvrD-helicase domain-containing protein [Sulfurovaceae bacterium]
MSKINKLIIAAAGAGKTTYLIKEALKQDKEVLITTYTEANESEIKKKFIEINGAIPKNVTIQTWFSMLLQHGVKPYQDYLTDKKINGMLLVNEQSGLKFRGKFPVYYKEEEVDKHYFSKEYKIYSDKLSKFVFKCNEKSSGAVFDRLSRIYDCIFIDEVQDLAGYDLELIKLLFQSNSNIILVGDPRQVTYLTHSENKYTKYRDGKIREFIQNECKKVVVEIDEESLNCSYRNNELICQFSSKLFPDYVVSTSNQNDEVEHKGIFLIKENDVDAYLEQFNPIQLRANRSRAVNNDYIAMNFGES